MKTLLGLKREAAKAAKFREHTLGAWVNYTATFSIARCDCGLTAFVNAKPAPNEIDICGSAIAANCQFPKIAKGENIAVSYDRKDAPVIAASFDLLEAAKQTLTMIEACGYGGNNKGTEKEHIKMLRAAISKAEEIPDEK